MSHAVPASYLRAVAATWPFVSRSAHRLRITRLVRRTPGVLDSTTHELAVELADWLQPRCRGLSLDALRALTEQAFFPTEQGAVSLCSLLAETAQAHLVRTGGRVTLAADARYAERLAELRWLTLLMPADLSIAALYAAQGSTDPPTDSLSLSDPPLHRLLAERPAAETHLHAGAAFSFGTIWTSIVGFLAADPMLANKLLRERACLWGEPASLSAMLVAAAVCRLFLGAYLCSLEQQGDRGTFDRWLVPYLDRVSPLLDPSRPRRATSLAHAALSTLVLGPQDGVPASRLSLLFRRLAGPRPAPPASLSSLAALDPMSSWLGAHHDPWPECRLATRAIRYLIDREDPAFADVFWQYERVRNQVFQFVVQQPGTAGLDWFQRHYDRLAPLRAPLRRLRFESALDLESRDIRLGSLEVRVSPPCVSSELVDDARELERAAREWAARRETVDVGLLVHFLKQREHGSGKRRRLHSDPRQLVHGCRFGAWAYRALREALAVERALRHRPELLLVVRGLDVASSELSVPTWATLPALRLARRASEYAADTLRRRRPDSPVEPFRTTYHAGEEYVRLVDGLRRLHELIEYGVVRSGDRLGHAMSLGDDVRRWSRRHPCVSQPREDRLDDLLWELDRYGAGDLPAAAGRVATVRDEAAAHGRVIVGRLVDLADLSAARRLRHDVDCLQRLGFPFVRSLPAGAGSLMQHVHAHLTDVGQYLRGREIISVEVSPGETSMLQDAQLWLRRRIASLGIAIESNPSSNILIGDFPSMEEHQSLLLCPLDGPRSPEHVLLSVNADDPVTFATRLSDEMAFVYASLLRSGASNTAALAWIGARRDEGFASRFTFPLGSPPLTFLAISNPLQRT